MRLPDVTPAQILAVVGWVAAQLVAYGVLTEQTSQLVVSSVSTLLAAAWQIGDAWIRHGRAQVVAAAIQAPGDTQEELRKARA